MEGSGNSSKMSPQLLDLISRESEWLVKTTDHSSSSDENKKLELSLAPPGQECSLNEHTTDPNHRGKGHDQPLLSLGSSVWFNQHLSQQATTSSANQFRQFPSKTVTTKGQNLPVMTEESPQPCCTKVVVDLRHNTGKKPFSQPTPAITAVPNSSQKRTAPGPVVGWPPIRSFRKNLTSSSSSKPAIDSQSGSPNKQSSNEKPVEPCKKGMFVKINMDDVPIGRKVNLNAYDSYEKLSTAVDELFRDLLAAQRDSSSGKQGEEKAITNILNGSGEYTLVYEDNEGDRMLVGDVPWHMFISAVRRLRVLKSSEVSALSLGSGKQDKVPVK